MKTNRIFLLAALPLLLAACKNAAPDDSFPNEYEGIKDMPGGWDGVGAPGGSNSGGQGEDMAGLVTASEWNDLAHWDFWGNLMNNQELYGYTETWKFFTNHRVAVRVAQSGSPVCGAKVRLSDGSGAVWNAVTDNKG